MKIRRNILLFFCISVIQLYAEKSPHGKDFKMDCAVCHTTNDWNTLKENGFNHNQTKFPLTGQHNQLNCKSCHKDLTFHATSVECMACHNDVHQNSLGDDCNRCHNTTSWIVNDLRKLHREKGFPLLGVHASLDCQECHTNSTTLVFENLANQCIDCHRQDYLSATNPNHVELGYSTNCIECHNQSSTEWRGNGFGHDFFPLNGGHALDCMQCHTDGFQQKLSSECISCHQQDYDNTTNPNHVTSGFSTDCATCHSIQTWNDAKFDHDKLYFPIYSGKHQGEWDNCTDCHRNTSNYSEFTCTDCHEHSKSKMDSENDDVRNYVYNSNKCYACHPRGQADD